MSDDIDIEDIEAQLSRIAAALERIADRLDQLGAPPYPRPSKFATMSPSS